MNGLQKQSKTDKLFDVLNYMILSFVLVITLYPLLYIISSSLSSPVEVVLGHVKLLPKEFTLDAYVRVFKNQQILNGYINTIKYTVVGTAVNLIMTIMGAYPLSRKKLYGRNFIMMVLTFSMFFSGGLIPTYLLIKSLHLVNNFWVMIIPGAVHMWNLIIMRTFFQSSIPEELYESAYMDGCTNARALVSIVLPLSTPVIAVTVLFYAVGHWNAFFSALIYIQDRTKYPLQLVLREILTQNNIKDMIDTTVDNVSEQQFLRETLKYAVIIVASLPVLILYPFIQKFFVKGVMVGAIKG